MSRAAGLAALLALTTCDAAPVPALESVGACDVLPEGDCACELDPVSECLLAATTCEAARACESVVE